MGCEDFFFFPSSNGCQGNWTCRVFRDIWGNGLRDVDAGAGDKKVPVPASRK